VIDRGEAERRLAAAGQAHVLRWFDELDAAGRQHLLAQIGALDLDWLRRVWQSELEPVRAEEITPYDEVIALDDAQGDRAFEEGEQALRAGRVATLLVAGGQGTRLGFDGPKGLFPIGAVSGHTLYQIHAERAVALGRRYGVIPPLYVMTSDANHSPTMSTFETQQRFGLPADRVLIFPQPVAPAVDEQGRLLLERRDALVMAPNGNGGLFAALRDSGALEHMRRCGVDTVSYIQVDNPLSLSCEPRFVGYHRLRGSQFSCKAIRKTGPHERVGTYARVRGRLRVVEYTEIPEEMARAEDARGELLYAYSNPGLFVWSVAFLEAQADRRDLPFHKAHKKIPHLDERGRLVEPAVPCGYKLEAFAMDTLLDAEVSLVLACDRDAEFAPVKNASGVDSAQSARALMTRLFTSWIERAGGRVVQPRPQIEISPLYALDAVELAAKLPRDLVVDGDLFLG
jgi:UDP-N-acetylglucosamine/UDP-N-acetylgalactosamine diphosphorylase